MVKRRWASPLLAFGLCLSGAAQAAEPEALPATGAALRDLRSPEQRDTRHTAYALPGGLWAFDIGALGISGGDAFAKLGVGYGFGAGIQLDINLAHTSVGLLNIAARWQFIDTRYFNLSAGAGFWYGNGEWFWIVRGPAKRLVSQMDVISVPTALNASAPVFRWLEADLGLEYTYGQVFGTVVGRSVFQDAYIGARQFTFHPGLRWFIWHNTALTVSAQLPAYTSIPVELDGDSSGESDYHKVPFSDVWSLEMGLRSRLMPGLFSNVRLHYGQVARTLYGAQIYPSFEVEVRL